MKHKSSRLHSLRVSLFWAASLVTCVFLQIHLVGFFIAASHTTRSVWWRTENVFFFSFALHTKPKFKIEYTQSLHWTSHNKTEWIKGKKKMWKVRDWHCVHGFLCSTLRQMSKVRNFNVLSCLYQRRWRNGEMAKWRRQYPKRQACLPGFKVCIRIHRHTRTCTYSLWGARAAGSDGSGGGDNIAVSNQMERKNGISIQIHRQYYSLLLYRLSVTSSFFEVCRIRVDVDMSCASHQILK